MSTRTSFARFWSTLPLTMLPSENDFIVFPINSCITELMIQLTPFRA